MGLDILPQPGIQECARPPWLTGPEPTPGCAPCKPDRGGPAWCCGPTHGSQCWALASTPSPSSATNDRGPAPDSRFHVLRHSSVERISFAWQHRSPSGREVLHLELELRAIYSEAAGVVSIARIERPLFYRGGSASTEIMPAVSPLSFPAHRRFAVAPREAGIVVGAEGFTKLDDYAM